MKVVTVLDQAPDREVDRLPLEDLRKLGVQDSGQLKVRTGGYRRPTVRDLHGGTGRDRATQISGCGALSGNVRPRA